MNLQKTITGLLSVTYTKFNNVQSNHEWLINNIESPFLEIIIVIIVIIIINIIIIIIIIVTIIPLLIFGRYTWYRILGDQVLDKGTFQNLTFPSVRAHHGGQYYCTASNQLGYQTSPVVTLTVLCKYQWGCLCVWDIFSSLHYNFFLSP